MNRQQLEFLIEAKLITKGQVRELERLFKKMETAEAQIKKIEKARKSMAKTQIKGDKEVLRTQRALNKVRGKNAKEAQKLGRSLGGLIKRQRDWNAENKKTEAALKRNSTIMAKTNAQLKQKMTLYAMMRRTLRGATKGVRNFGAASSGVFSTTLRTIRRIMTTMLTLGALFFFRNLIRQGAEFEHVMIRIGAIAGATAKTFKNLVNTMRGLARETVFTASQVSETAQVLAQAGFDVQEILGALHPILKLTAATMGELKVTTELVAAILRTFNMEITQTTDIVNVLTEATVSSRADITRLAKAFRFAGPAGAAFNQSLETTIASLSKFIDLGLSASIAGTTFRRALIQLSQGTEKQIKVLQKINVRFAEVNPSLHDFGQIIKTLAQTTLDAGDAIKLFGARAGAAVFTMIKRTREGVEGITEFTKKLADAKETNRVEQVYKKMMKSIQSESLITKAELEDLGLTLFQVFKPAIAKIVHSLRDAFRDMNDELQRVTGKSLSNLLQDVVPLFSTLFSAIVSIIKVFGTFVFVLSKIPALIWLVNKALKIFLFYLGLLAIRGLIASKAIGFIWRGMRILRVTTRHTTLALKMFRATLSSFILPIVLLSIGLILEKIIRYFSKAKEGAEESADGLQQLGVQAGFAEKRVQQLNEQLKLQASNMQELINMQKEGKIAFATMGTQALGISLPTLDFGTLQISGAEKQFKRTFDQIIEDAEDVADKMSIISADIDENLEDLVVNLGKNRQQLFRDVERISKQSAEGIAKIFQGATAEDFFNEIVAATKLMSEGVKITSEDMAKQLTLTKEQKKLIEGNAFIQLMFDNAVKQTVESAKSLAKEVKIIDKELNKAIKEPVQDSLLTLIKLRNEVESLGLDYKVFVAGGVSAQNKLFEDQVRITALLETHQLNIELESRKIVNLRRQQNKLIDQGQIEAAKALEVLVDEHKFLKAIAERNKEILETAKKRLLNQKLAELQEKRTLKAIELEISLRQRLKSLMDDRKKDYVFINSQTTEFFKNLSEGAFAASDINKEFALLQKQIGFAKQMTLMKDITKEIAQQSTFQKDILDLDAKIVAQKAIIQEQFFSMTGEEKAQLTAIQNYVEAGKDKLNKLTAINSILQMTTEQENLTLAILKNKEKLLKFVETKEKSVLSIAVQHQKIEDDLNKNMFQQHELIKRNADMRKLELKTIIVQSQLIAQQLRAGGRIAEAERMEAAIKAAFTEMGKIDKLTAEQLKQSTDQLRIDSERNKLTKKYLEYEMDAVQEAKNLKAAQENLKNATGDQVEKWKQIVANVEKAVDRANKLATGDFWPALGVHLNDMINDFFEAQTAAEATAESIKNIGGKIKSIGNELAKEQLGKIISEQWFGILSDEAKEMADALAKITKDLAEKIAEIWDEFRKAMRDAEREHLKNMEDIRIRFDDMRREREIEIYNERVERLMALAALEQELRLQGLTTEQQRAQLLTEIDQNLASVRLGTIEERQIKMAELEAQIKAVNQLENTLGLTRAEIEASSLARLGQLRQATSEFFDDKRTAAINSIEAERAREITAEANRHAEQQDRLRRERDEAIAKAELAAENARAELKIEKDKDDKMKRLMADLTAFSIIESGKAILAYAKEAVAGMATGVAKTFAQLGVFALAALPAIIAGIFAFKASIKNRYQGGSVEEQSKRMGGEVNRISGGMIRGGHGGIDDIHTAMPVGSYIVNRQSTRTHRAELATMVLEANPTVRASRQAPVAVTAGEYAMFPPVSIAHRDRLEQINSERSVPRDIGHMTGQRFQGGGAVSNAVGGGTTINNFSAGVTFAGTNIITGDEQQITEIYEVGMRKLVQKDLDNKELNT